MGYDISYKFQPALQIQSNSSKTFDFTIYNEFNKIVNLSGTVGTFEVFLDKPGINDASVISKNISLVEAEKGTCLVSLSDSDTSIDPKIYKYRLSFNSSGNTIVYGDGVFDLLGDDNTRINQIKRNKGLAFDYYVLENALNDARQSIKDFCFSKKEEELRQKKSEIKIDNYLADSNFDEVLDSKDIELIEYQNESPYTVNNLNGNITSIIPNHPSGKTIIMLDNEYPTDETYTLKVSYYKTVDKYENIKYGLFKLEELYVMQYLMENLEAHKLQRGITDKTIGSQTISFNHNAIMDYQKNLKSQILRETMKLKPIVNRSVQISKRY